MKMIDFMDELITGGSEKKAGKYADKGIDAFRNVEVPELQEYSPDNFEYVGDFDPALLQNLDDINFGGIDPRLADVSTVDRSRFSDISTDPRLKDAQYDSLSALDDIIAGGGMTLSDEASLSAIQGDVAQADRGRRGAIQQDFAQRGMGGSGLEMLQMLSSSQAATDRASQGGMDIAAMAQQRALDAIMNNGAMAGNMRSQDFGEQANIAQAQDAIAQFNAQNTNNMNQFNTSAQNNAAMYNNDGQFAANQYNQARDIGVQQANVGALNDAGMFNNTNRQQTSNMNTQTNNDAQMHNKFTAPNTQYGQQLDRAAGLSGAYGAAAGNQQTTAQRRVEGQKAAGEMVIAGMGKGMSGGAAG